MAYYCVISANHSECDGCGECKTYAYKDKSKSKFEYERHYERYGKDVDYVDIIQRENY